MSTDISRLYGGFPALLLAYLAELHRAVSTIFYLYGCYCSGRRQNPHGMIRTTKDPPGSRLGWEVIFSLLVYQETKRCDFLGGSDGCRLSAYKLLLETQAGKE